MNDLINKDGMIEKAREIIEGAPDKTTLYYSDEDGDLVYFRDGDYFDNDYGDWFEIYFMVPELKSLSDLRTAIADYDEYHCDHYWMHDHMGKFRECIKCNERKAISVSENGVYLSSCTNDLKNCRKSYGFTREVAERISLRTQDVYLTKYQSVSEVENKTENHIDGEVN